MSLPEQLKKQTEAITEYYRKVAENAAPGVDASEGEAPTEPNSTPPADESSPAAVQPQANEQPPAGDNDSENENSETFAQRWRSLQGSYNAQVRANREMQQRLQNMEQLLASLSSQSAQPAQAAQQPSQTVQKLVSEKDVEEYGESIDVMRKVTREELHEVASRIARIESALQQMQSHVVPQVQAVAKRQAVSAEQQFWTDLTGAVSNWREINGNPTFQEWLLQSDPLTGITRQTYLEDAQGALDANRVANIFRTWLANTGQASAAQKPTRSAASELEKQVTPGRSKTAQAPATNKPKTYTPEDIRTFFNEVRAGKFKGREQERDRIERDIFAAQRDNRIVNA